MEPAGGARRHCFSLPEAAVGGFIELEVFPQFTFQVGVQFAGKGAKLTVLTPGLPKPSMEVTHQFNYLEFPINLKLAISRPSFQVYSTAGITLGTLLKAVGEFEGGETKDLRVLPAGLKKDVDRRGPD